MSASTPDQRDRRYSLTIDGADVVASDEFEVINPATGAAFATAPAATATDVDHAFASAERAFALWRHAEDERVAAMLRAADAIEAAAPQLASVLTAEQGKPLKDSAVELIVATTWLRYFASLPLPVEVVRDDDTGYAEVHRRPLGVVAAITPWNFPVALAMWKIAPALRAGNTVVLKPSPHTPLATLALCETLRGVLPDGVLNVVTGPEPLGSLVSSNPGARKVSFTGSTTTGKQVASAAAADLKRLTLELGGNDPAIVLSDVNVEEIAPQLFWGAFVNNGQACLAVKRVYVHSSVHDDLVDALAAIADSVVVADGTNPEAMLGPVNNLHQLDRVATLVDNAIGGGGRAASGGHRPDGPGYFYRPTIISGVSDDTALVAEEQFGPALPVLPFTDVPEAIERANKGHYGLTASIWSADPGLAGDVARHIDAGQVSVNVHAGGARPDLPFGGHKWSGIGVENGPWGLLSFTETQVICGPPR